MMMRDATVAAFRYRAFISYSHHDSAWAGWLHRALERYAVPRHLIGRITAVGPVPRRLAPIFRDRDELASATDLSVEVNDALAQSASLIVICSPHAARSRWVNEEVLAFKRLGRAHRIFCLVVGGEPSADGGDGCEGEACFPPALRSGVDEDGPLDGRRAEPVAADIRPGRDTRSTALLRLIAGMLGLGFDSLRQREQQRRTRRTVALAALALVVTLSTTTLAVVATIARNEADRARSAAERRQKQAEDLVSFMLGDLSDKLGQVARLDIMESVDDQAMRYFKSLPTTDVTDRTLASRVEALVNIGDVRIRQGHLPAAEEAFRAALRIAEARAQSAPDDVSRQLVRANAWGWLGYTHWYMGRFEAARHDFDTAQRVLDQAQERAPGNLQLLYQRATMENNTGQFLEANGRLKQAEQRYRRMLELCRRLVAAQPDNRQWMQQLGNAHNNLGKMSLLRGDLVGAVERYATDDAIETRLAARDPRDNNQRGNVLMVRAILGRTLALGGDIDAGKRDLQAAVNMAGALARLDSENSVFREDHARYAYQLARLQRLSGNAAAARASVQDAIRELRRLVQQSPQKTDLQRELAEAMTERAAQLRHAGKVTEARNLAGKAMNALVPLLQRRPHDRKTLLATSAVRLLVADTTADGTEAARLRMSVLKTVEAEPSGRDDPRLLALKVRALLALGRSRDASSPLEALRKDGYRDAELLADLKRAHVRYPANPEARERLHAAVRAARGR